MPTKDVYDSRSVIHTDPIRNFKFLVEFNKTGLGNDERAGFYSDTAQAFQDGKSVNPKLGFMSVSGLSVATEAIPYREGGDNTTPRKLPGQSNFSDITLTRGVVIGSARHWEWMKRIFHAIQGGGKAASRGADAYFRWNVDIHVLHHPTNTPDKLARPKVSFRVYNAWISSLAFSDLDAGGNAVLVEQLTLTHEGFDVDFATKAGIATSGNFAI